MVAYIRHSLVVVFGVFLFVMYKCGSFVSHSTTAKEKKLLLIGVLSAPEHFDLRDAIRKTWMKDTGNEVVHYFLIGKHMCHIPKEDRIDEFSCNESAVFFPAVSDIGENGDNLHVTGTFICPNINSELPVYHGYTFTVLHDIIIHRMGMLSDVCQKTVRVSLLEAATGSKITSATFATDESSNSSTIWKPVERYRLPKGFEGRIVLEAKDNSREWLRCGFSWGSSGSGNIVAPHLLWTPQGHPVHFHERALSAVAFGFELADVDNLTRFLAQKPKRVKQWNERVSFINKKLKEESSKMGDILFIDVVDVYRSLPKKMLQFFEWAEHNIDFSFLLKTDDDTFISLSKVVKELQLQNLNDKDLHSRIWWWSAFRRGWPVQVSGKWREAAYHSVTYPPFPCGAGYVLSHGAVSFLSSVADKLFTDYQGEDAALGIWLASTNPLSTENLTACFWSCDTPLLNKCLCNYPQLSAARMLEIYKQMQEI